MDKEIIFSKQEILDALKITLMTLIYNKIKREILYENTKDCRKK